MARKRTDRLNSLLKEVLSEVIRKDVKDPKISELLTVTHVDITKDLRHAKVYISVIGDEITRKNTLRALRSASGYISVVASKKVVMRFFPKLDFMLDDSVDRHMRIEELLKNIEEKK